MIEDPKAWPLFSSELKEIIKLKNIFTEFSTVFNLHTENVSSDTLIKIAISFHRELYYISCSFFGLVPRTTSSLIE